MYSVCWKVAYSLPGTSKCESRRPVHSPTSSWHPREGGNKTWGVPTVIFNKSATARTKTHLTGGGKLHWDVHHHTLKAYKQWLRVCLWCRPKVIFLTLLEWEKEKEKKVSQLMWEIWDRNNFQVFSRSSLSFVELKVRCKYWQKTIFLFPKAPINK